jgi:Tfp pilus assembly protein PilV
MSRIARRKNNAFTLVETLVAISIIMVAVLGPFALIENNINAAYITRDEIIANSLAQEGIEYAVFTRDSVYLYNQRFNQSNDFTAYMDGTPSGAANCIAPNYCTIDPTGTSVNPSWIGTFQQCPGGTCTPLYTRPAPDYTYTQQSSGNTQSRFTRTLQICYLNGTICNSTLSNEAKVTVVVSWVTLGKTYSTTVTDYLQNWLK